MTSLHLWDIVIYLEDKNISITFQRMQFKHLTKQSIKALTNRT